MSDKSEEYPYFDITLHRVAVEFLEELNLPIILMPEILDGAKYLNWLSCQPTNMLLQFFPYIMLTM